MSQSHRPRSGFPVPRPPVVRADAEAQGAVFFLDAGVELPPGRPRPPRPKVFDAGKDACRGSDDRRLAYERIRRSHRGSGVGAGKGAASGPQKERATIRHMSTDLRRMLVSER